MQFAFVSVITLLKVSILCLVSRLLFKLAIQSELRIGRSIHSPSESSLRVVFLTPRVLVLVRSTRYELRNHLRWGRYHKSPCKTKCQSGIACGSLEWNTPDEAVHVKRGSLACVIVDLPRCRLWSRTWGVGNGVQVERRCMQISLRRTQEQVSLC